MSHWGDKMKNADFGSLLKELRKLSRLTQADACKDICSLRQYVRLENNISEPSMYLVQLLSHRFNYDLLSYYKLIYCDQTLQANTLKTEADELVKNGDYKKLQHLISKIQTMPEFQRGENLQCLYYYKSLISCFYTQDYMQAINFCISGLHIEDTSITKTNFIGKISSNVGLSLLNTMACAFFKLSNTEKAIEIWNRILIDIEKKMSINFSYYQSSIEFVKQLYLSTSYNIGIQKTLLEDYQSALEYFDKGIYFATQYNCLYYLTNIVRQKMRVLYSLKRYTEARRAYDVCMGLYILRNDISELENCEKIMKEDFPELLNLKSYV